MSTILISTSKKKLSETSNLMKFTNKSKVEVFNDKMLAIVSSRVDNLNLWGYAHDDQSNTTVFLGGRIAFEQSEWQRAKSIEYQGGLACKLILEKFLYRKNTEEFYSYLNGAYGIIIYEKNLNKLHLITDRMGIFPFYFDIKDGLAISTHPDILVDHIDPFQSFEIDDITIAEVIAKSESVFPHTYYKQVKQLHPASHYEFAVNSKLDIISRNEYWEPAYLTGNFEYNKRKIVFDLAEAIQKAVELRSHNFFEKCGVLLSGGIDSRGILFSLKDRAKAETLTYCRTTNSKEYKIAKILSDIAGVSNIPLIQGKGHYFNYAEKAVRIFNGFWSVATDHLTPLIETIEELNYDVIFTGCYSDYLFKGLSDNLTYYKIFNKKLPFKRIGQFDKEYYYKHTLLKSEYENLIKIRWDERFKICINNRKLNKFRIAGIAEDLRMRPISREADISGRLVLWRTLPWDHLLSDSHILDIYGKIPIHLKKYDTLFSSAILKILPNNAKTVINSNNGMKLGSGILRSLLNIVYKKKNNLSLSKSNTRSLKELTELMSHKGTPVNKIWKNRSLSEEKYFQKILGFNPWKIDLNNFGEKNKHLVFRFFTIHTWLKERGYFNE